MKYNNEGQKYNQSVLVIQHKKACKLIRVSQQQTFEIVKVKKKIIMIIVKKEAKSHNEKNN